MEQQGRDTRGCHRAEMSKTARRAACERDRRPAQSSSRVARQVEARARKREGEMRDLPSRNTISIYAHICDVDTSPRWTLPAGLLCTHLENRCRCPRRSESRREGDSRAIA